MTASRDWAPVTTITPLDGEAVVELDSPIAGRRVRVARDAIAAMIAGTTPANDSLVEELNNRLFLQRGHAPFNDFTDGIELWTSHNWDLSLSYYLWSRRATYLDDGPDSHNLRATAIAAMLGESSYPAQPVPETTTVPISALVPEGVPLNLGASLLARKSQLRVSGPQATRDQLTHVLQHGLQRYTQSRRVGLRLGETSQDLISFGSAIDVYLLVYDVHDLAPGIYLHDPYAEALRIIEVREIAREARVALLAHPDSSSASASIILAAHYPRYQWLYRHERALRNLWIDSGRILQELLIVATSLRMETGITPAVSDTAFGELLRLEPWQHQVLHTLTLSGPR